MDLYGWKDFYNKLFNKLLQAYRSCKPHTLIWSKYGILNIFCLLNKTIFVWINFGVWNMAFSKNWCFLQLGSNSRLTWVLQLRCMLWCSVLASYCNSLHTPYTCSPRQWGVMNILCSDWLVLWDCTLVHTLLLSYPCPRWLTFYYPTSLFCHHCSHLGPAHTDTTLTNGLLSSFIPVKCTPLKETKCPNFYTTSITWLLYLISLSWM